MANGRFKQVLLAQFARCGKTMMGNGNQLEISEFLAQSERSVVDLSRPLNLSQ